MNRIWFVVVFVFISVGLMSGCSEKTEKPYEAVQDPKGSLTVVTSFGETDGNRKNYMKYVEQFEEETGAVVIDDSGISNEQWKNDVLEMVAKNEEPDVLFFFSGVSAEPIVSKDKVVDIETIKAEYPLFASEINANILNNMRASDGLIYAVPVTGYWESMFVNKDLFEDNNIALPGNWDQFLTAIDEFNKLSITPVAVSINQVPHYWFEFLIYNYAGPSRHLALIPTDPENLPAEWIKGLNDFKMLYEMNAFPKNTDEIIDDESFAMFQNKEAAMLIDGSWKVGAIDDKENVIVIPVPSADETARKPTDMISGFSMGFYITKKAWEDETKRDLAVSFVHKMSSSEAVRSFNESGAASPIVFSSENYENPLLHSVYEAQEQASAYAPAAQDTFTLDARTYLFSNISNIVRGELEIEEALKEFIELNKK